MVATKTMKKTKSENSKKNSILDDDIKEKAFLSKLAYEDHRQRKKAPLQYNKKYSTMETAVFTKTNEQNRPEFVIASRGTCLGCKGSKDASMKKENKSFTSILENASQIGTTAAKDLTTDVLVAFGLSHLSHRYRDLNELVKKIEQENEGSKITLTGHSLGGRLAHDIARKRGYESIIFNPGSSPVDFLSHKWIEPTGSGNKHRMVYVKDDFVSHYFTYPSTEVIQLRKDKRFHPHSIDNFIIHDDEDVSQ